MKKITLLLSLVFLSFWAFGQNRPYDEDKPETILGKINKVGVFGGFGAEFSQMKGQNAYNTTTEINLLLDRHLVIGFYSSRLQSDINTQTTGFDGRLNFRHRGLNLAYVTNSDKLFHFNLGAKIGWGTAGWNNYGQSSNLFVATPNAELEINITRFLRVGLSAGYRVVSGLKDDTYIGQKSSDLNSITGSASLRFGWF